MSDAPGTVWAMSPNWRVSGVGIAEHFYDAHGVGLCGRKYGNAPKKGGGPGGTFVHMRYCRTCLAIRTRMLGGQGGRPEEMLNGDLTGDMGEGEE